MERRADQRTKAAARRSWFKRNGHLGSSLSKPDEKTLELARHGMRILRAAVGRIRELMVRSRMRAPVGVPMALIIRDSLGLRDLLAGDNDDDEPLPLSAASRLPLLRKGAFVLTRHVEERGGGAKETTPGQWRVARLVKDVARLQADANSPRRVLEVVEGAPWTEGEDDDVEQDADSTDLEFVAIPTNHRRRLFGDIFPAPRKSHISGLFVVEPEHIFHSSEGDVLRLSSEQTQLFDRVSGSHKPAWWEQPEDDEPDEEEEEQNRNGAAAAAGATASASGGGGSGGGGSAPMTTARGGPARQAAVAARIALAARPL